MNKQKLAKELCQKDSKDWSELNDAEKHGYMHYADAVIRKKAQPVKERGKARGHSHDKPDEGLPDLLIIPEAINGKTLAETADIAREIIKASVPKPYPALQSGQYLCGECKTPHRETSKIGKKHLKYKVEDDTDSGTG